MVAAVQGLIFKFIVSINVVVPVQQLISLLCLLYIHRGSSLWKHLLEHFQKKPSAVKVALMFIQWATDNLNQPELTASL